MKSAVFYYPNGIGLYVTVSSVCDNCGAIFLGNTKYCPNCSITLGFHQSDEWITKRLLTHFNSTRLFCEICGEPFWRSISEIERGDDRFCSKDCYYEWQRGTPKSNRLKALWRDGRRKGSNNANWTGGSSHSERETMWVTGEYQEWRQAVFTRDNYMCQKCGIMSEPGVSVYLCAHHKKSWALFPELRFDVNNGITLCQSCHNLEPKGREIYATNTKAIL